MKEPILSREHVIKIVRKTLKENNDRDKLSADVFVKLYAALEEAWVAQLGQPRAWILPDIVSREFTGMTLTRSASVAERHGGEPLYSLKEKHHG